MTEPAMPPVLPGHAWQHFSPANGPEQWSCSCGFGGTAPWKTMAQLYGHLGAICHASGLVMTPVPRPAPRPAKPRGRIARTSRPRKRRASVHAGKVRKANELWRQIIYAKEPSGICPRCKARPWHDAMHFFTKGAYPSMQFELSNGAPGCRQCHRRIDSDFIAKLDFVIRYIGQAEYDRLVLMSQGRGRMDIDLTILFLRQKFEGIRPRAVSALEYPEV